MKCRVLPTGELSYCVKCVAVESERVFGDVVVTCRSSAAELPAAYQRSRQNLVQQYLEGPNFLELNRRRPIRRQSAAIAEEGKRDSELKLVARSTRSKSMNLQGTWLGPDLTEHERTRKVYTFNFMRDNWKMNSVVFQFCCIQNSLNGLDDVEAETSRCRIIADDCIKFDIQLIIDDTYVMLGCNYVYQN